MMVFTVTTLEPKGGKPTYENLELVDGATDEEILGVVSSATSVVMFASSMVDREVAQTALRELKEVIDNHDQIESWEGNVYWDNEAKVYGDKQQYKVGLSKYLRNGITGASLVSALVGSITS